MAALSGQRAAFVGVTSQHAEALIRTLRAADADVVVIDRAENAAGATLVCDMSETGIAEALRLIGPIDILVVTPPAVLESPGGDAATLSAALATALEPAFLWTKAVATAMRERKSGVIVHLTGPSGLGGWPGWEVAGTTFAAIHNFVQSFATDVAPAGVRVNALVPGITKRQAEAIASTRTMPIADVASRIPLHGFLPDDALSNALLYLVHPSSSYVSGEILTVDGGWAMWGRLNAVAS
ncbi:MAG: SDR family oxidoreductase [Devosia sp.]